MNASIESIMNGYGDPRREFYFEHCTATDLKGEYRGIRQGTCFAHNRYNTLSKLTVDQSTDAVLMTARRGVVSSCGGGIAGLDIRGCGRML